MKQIAVLGSTGSIGKSTLRIVQHLPTSFRVAGLAAHSNIELLAEQIRTFSPDCVAVYRAEKAEELQRLFPSLRVLSGEEGLAEVAALSEVECVVMAIVGMRALGPTICAIEAGKTIALASKEVLVSAGEYVMDLARSKGVSILPVDSEHSAIFQCLEGRDLSEVQRVILTASGGPFRNHSQEDLDKVTVEEALCHPTWDMGPKVTIDSSTLINKGLEMIEARWLFDIPPEKIDVVIHPQSIIHSFVEFIDGSIIAQICEPNMVYPIQYALTYPKRKPGMFSPFDFAKNSRLEFFPPDRVRFPSLRLAQKSMEAGKSTPCYLNAANEVLVDRFLKREISWKEIPQCLERLLQRHEAVALDSLDTILSIDHEARQEAMTA